MSTNRAYVSWVVLFVSAILFLHAMYIYNAPVVRGVEHDPKLQEQQRLEEKRPEDQQLEKKQELQLEQQNKQLQLKIEQLQQQLQQQLPQQQLPQQQVLTNTSFEAKKQIFYKFFRAGIRGCVGVEEIMCILKDSYEEGSQTYLEGNHHLVI